MIYDAQMFRQGMRILQSAKFRIVYIVPDTNGWMRLSRYFFVIFCTQLQWLAMEIRNTDAARMVSSILLIQTVVIAHANPVGSINNIINKVVAVTFAISGAFIINVAIMAYINISRRAGKQEWLCNNQEKIYYCIQALGLLITPLLIPCIVHRSDPLTGYQEFYPWLWWLVGFLCLGIWILLVIWYCYFNGEKSWQKKAKKLEEPMDWARVKPIQKWTIEEVKDWISKGKELVLYSRFTVNELAEIGAKFETAKVDGCAFIQLTHDAIHLTKHIHIEIGEAIHFVGAIDKIKDENIVLFDEDLAEELQHRKMTE